VNFFSEDDEASLLPRTEGIRGVELQNTFSLSVAASSSLSVDTVVPQGILMMSLGDLCSTIEKHRSLQKAEISMTEAYTQLLGAVRHRFLVLELHREGRKKIWLRLDRRAGRSTFGLLRAGGSVPAHDVVSFLTLNLISDSNSSRRSCQPVSSNWSDCPVQKTAKFSQQSQRLVNYNISSESLATN
jgi:hypothetical protein